MHILIVLAMTFLKYFRIDLETAYIMLYQSHNWIKAIFRSWIYKRVTKSKSRLSENYHEVSSYSTVMKYSAGPEKI